MPSGCSLNFTINLGLIIIKKAVDLKLRGRILFGLVKAMELASEMGATEFRITSGYRKKTGKLSSFHPVRLAVDFVVEGVNNTVFRNVLKKRLSTDYDLIHHNAGTGPHFHMEFDEK